MARSLLTQTYKTSLSPLAKLSNVSTRCMSSTLPWSKAVKKDGENKQGFFSKLLSPDSSIADKSFTNRWAMFVPAFGTHICLGAPYGWSAISSTLSKELGFVASSSADWTLDLCTYPMSIMIAAGGISSALLGKWTMKVGTRRAMVTGGALYGSAFGLTALGVSMHSLPMLYAGNLLAGIAFGCTYTPPIQAVIEWFPDKRGMASGIVIAGFGSGALFFTPAMNKLSSKFAEMPEYLGKSIETITEGGKMFAKAGDAMQEVVYATASDLAKLPYSDLSEGFYVVGSGNTGVAGALASIAAFYGVTVITSSFLMKKPAPGYIPQGWTPPAIASGIGSNVDASTVLKTPQFWLLFTTSTVLCTGGMGLMSVAKPMISEVFATSMPTVVTASFASSYLLAMASGNLAGRLGWAAVSDKIGQKATFNCFTFGAVPIFAALPYCIEQVVMNPTGPMAPVYLGAFCASTVAAISIMGGTFAVLPAYEANLYGPKYVQVIHGRFLLAATLSTILGPSLLLTLRKSAESSAIQELLAKVNPATFIETFGTDLTQAQSLIEAKTLTISKLMTIMPPGTIDPSPFIYNNTMYTMAGLISVGAALHLMVRPVNPKYFEKV